MHTLIYDSSPEGWLTAVFEIYEYKWKETQICRKQSAQTSSPGNIHTVHNNPQKAARVWKKLQQVLSVRAISQLYKSLLSEVPGIENILLRYVQHSLSPKQLVEYTYGNRDANKIQEISKKVQREKHRMEAFIRFQSTADGLLYTIIQPDHNVLPLVRNHFRDKYPDQQWMIYDCIREYGIYYDLSSIEEVTVCFREGVADRKNIRRTYGETENLYQVLCRPSFDSSPARPATNMKLHIQHMPARYWKFLPEKKPEI